MPIIRVSRSAGLYDVHCARGVISRSATLVSRLGSSTGTFVLSSPRVWRHLGAAVYQALRCKNERQVILFNDSESAKRLSTVEEIARKLLRAGADRQCVIVAVGGGVVGDVAGFTAATYLRGVRLVHIPTTVVAQVDSAIGGKTGVDLPEGKNLVGAFYPPEVVIADANLLGTLPQRQYRSGLYEVVKYGIIADRELFHFLERRMPAILRRDPGALAWIVPRCVRVKARIVGKDERESGLRQILNFGHTLGHALEAATGYRRFLHGEAVGWGMIMATLLAVGSSLLSQEEACRIVRLIRTVGPLPALGALRMAMLRGIMRGDKKARSGRVLWVLPSAIGKVEWGMEVPWNLLQLAYSELPFVAGIAET
jgi:3-dehydroquinate synthase